MKFTHYAEPLELETTHRLGAVGQIRHPGVRDDVIAIESTRAP